MSGAASIPFAAIALFSTGNQRLFFAALAFVALWVFVGSVALKNLELHDKLRPKIKIECGRDVVGCHTNPTVLPIIGGRGERLGQKVVRFFRAAVSSDFPGIITGCCGKIIAIERDGNLLWGGDTQVLTFAPGNATDALAKVIHESHEFLDILLISNEGEISMATPGYFWRFEPLNRIFSDVDDYILTIVIVGNGVGEVRARLRFHWTRNWTTSEISLAD
jgi:hypothetical protein